MNAKEWILELKEVGVLKEGQKNGKSYLHLQTPCKIHLSENATQQIRDTYEANVEKGGVLVALPQRENGITHLHIDRLIYLTNISDDKHRSYLPNPKELDEALTETYSGKDIKYFAIRFHTHPTHSENPFNEMLNYIYQCNTSNQDQLVSDFPVSIGEINVLMPRCLILCNGRLSNRTFIGFYNGLIAPIEFEIHRNEQREKAMQKIFDKIEEWLEKDSDNKWWLIGGGLAMALLIIRYYKFAIPLILLIFLMSQSFISSEHENPQYFAQVINGKITIDIP